MTWLPPRRAYHPCWREIGHRPEPCEVMEFAKAKRWRRHNYLTITPRGRVLLSTVFLGTDMGFPGPVPILYETTIFFLDSPEPHDGDILSRYATRRQAIRHHKRYLRQLHRNR